MLSILKASAGSGKTFALTREYIRLLLGHKDGQGRMRLNRRASDRHRAILAITFTNKATDEMKQRIVHELAVLADLEKGNPQKSPYLDFLTDSFGCSADEVCAEAGRALRQLLFDFSFFNISTIDSFFQFILRTFAYEAELEGDYDVDLDTRSAIARAADDLFASLNANPDSEESKKNARWITRYLTDQLREGKSVALFNRASDSFDNFVGQIYSLSDERFTSRFDEMMEYFRAGRLDTLGRQLVKLSKDTRADVSRKCADALSAINANPLTAGGYDSNMVKALGRVADKGEFPTGITIANIAAGNKEPYTKAAAKCFADGAMAGVYNAITDACRAVVDAQPVIECADNIAANLFVLGLFEGIYRRLEEARATDNVLLLSDTNALLREIIGDDDAPFVFERIGVNLRHFLIDEFQDTSTLQWEILRPLVSNSHSEGHDNLIIGDEKQCIYRFRGSEPGLLKSAVQSQIPEPVSVCGNTPSENTNWRSSADVVTANNTIFGSVARVYGFDDIYSNVEQQIAARNKGRRGYVSLRRYGDADHNDPAYIEHALDRMLEEMLRQLASGYRGSDIAVLVRSGADGARVVSRLLSAFSSDPRFMPYGLRVISDDAMTVDSAPVVRRIVAVLRAMACAQNHDLTEAEAGTSHYYRSRAELTCLVNRYENCLGLGRSPSEALSEAVRLSNEPIAPPLDLSAMACASLPSLVERIVAHYFPGGTVPAGELLFLMAFEDAVADFCAGGAADIQSFLRWWDTTGHSTKVASSADLSAVRVMTIHKAKGLEFPCVHLPLMHDELVKFTGPEWFDSVPVAGLPADALPPLIALQPKDWMLGTAFEAEYNRKRRESLLDSVNVLYVAFTRAVDELIVSYSFSLPKKGAEEKVAVRPTSGQLIDRALRAAGFEDEETCWGAPTTAPAAEEARSQRAIDPTGAASMPDYRLDERDSLWANTRIDTAADDALGRRRGVVMHDILANVGSAADLRRAVDSAVRCGELPRPERDATYDMLADAIAAVGSYTDRWFAADARPFSERSIAMPDGSTLRPDRIVRYADGSIDVIDYKFGEEHKRAHGDQVRRYTEALAALYGPQTPIRGYVWYVAAHTVREI